MKRKRSGKTFGRRAVSERPTLRALAVIHGDPSPTDPLGMYTGIPADPKDEPQQDADDL